MSQIVDNTRDYRTNNHNNGRGTGYTNNYKKHGQFNTKRRYSPRQNYHYHHPYKKYHHYYKKTRERYYKKKPSRPSSPLYGTEEYTQKKIQETSDMIKKQLMMPFELINNVSHDNSSDRKDENSELKSTDPANQSMNSSTTKKIIKPQQQQQQKKTIAEEYDVNQIHEKIIDHISNLSLAKKINLICSTSSGYDAAIQQIQKQKRLELSKALRDMCSKKSTENTEIINSIIPDIGIKIEQLPFEVIQELSKTLDLDFDNYDHVDSSLTANCEPNQQIKTERIDNNLLEEPIIILDDEIEIKNEEIEHFVDDPPDIQSNNEATVATHKPSISIKTDLFEDNCNKMVKCVETAEKCVQTELNLLNYQGAIINEDDFVNSTTTLPEAIRSMNEIDKEIGRLTKLRQRIFYNLEDNQQNNGILNEKNSGKKRKILDPNHDEIDLQLNNNDDDVDDDDDDSNVYHKQLSLGNLSEKILIIKMIKNHHLMVAGAESGNLFFIDVKLDIVVKKIQISTTPLTSLMLYHDNNHLFIGCLDSTIIEYDLFTKQLIKHLPISGGVQCLEISWNYLFIGTNNGNLIRYAIQRNKIEFEENISLTNILVLKATQEGARKVLLVGTRNSPICIRDALSGLHMRTMDGLISPTVYTLLLEDSLVYCGTTAHDILIFSFHDGNLLHKYNASRSKGIGCMKIVGNLLFASCYNGNIYVYHKRTHAFVGNIHGPGGVVLSMEIVDNLVIVGTICFKFKSIQIPDFILEYNR